MSMTTTRATTMEIQKAILSYVSIMGNLTPSEIFYPIHALFPKNNHYEIKQIVKDMEKNNTLVPDIIYGGLKAA